MAAVMLAELRGLARLYRDGVDGVRDQLADVIAVSGSELPDILGFPRANLERLHRNDDPVGVLVDTIEGAQRVAREARGQAQRASARELAAAAAESAQVRLDGDIEIDPALVTAACAAWPTGGDIVFSERGGIDVRRLRSLLKECRRLPISMLLTTTSLNIKWATPRSRGYFKLWLRPAAIDADNLMVPLAAVPTSHVDIVAEAMPLRAIRGDVSPEAVFVSPAAEAGPSSTADGSCRPHDAAEGGEVASRPRETPVSVVEAPRRFTTHRPPRRGLAVRFIEAIAAAMGPS